MIVWRGWSPGSGSAQRRFRARRPWFVVSELLKELLDRVPKCGFRNDLGLIRAAKRLHAAVARDNVLIKVPATPAGIPAIEELIGAGMNINVTLIFGLEVYEAVANAYIAGLEKLAAAGGDVRQM